MTVSLLSCIRLIERRVAALRMLASSLEEATAALSAWDTNGLHGAMVHVDHLASELSYLEEEVVRHMERLATATGKGARPTQEQCFAALVGELEGEEARNAGRIISEFRVAFRTARGRGRAFEALLRRSRRSVSVLMNFHGMRSTSDGTGTVEQLARPPMQVKV